MYVEPTTMAASKGRVLIAGWPAYLFARGLQSRPKQVGSDSVLGVIFQPGRPATTIRAPSDAQTIGGVRALGRADGAWDVVFADLVAFSPERVSRPDTALRLWHGVYDGERWKSLEEIPRPSGFLIHPLMGTRLVRSGDTLSWAVLTTTPRGRDVLVLRRTDDGWSGEAVGTPGAAYVEMMHARRAGHLLAVVQVDTSLRTSDENSLFLYSRDSVWRVARRVARGGMEPAHHPSLHWDDGPVLTWYVDGPSGGQVRMVRNPGGAHPGEMGVLDSAFTGGRQVISLGLESGSYWVVNHRPQGEKRTVLRVVRSSGNGPAEVARWESPFLSGVRGISVGDSDIFLAGALWMDRDSIPVSLLLHARAQCTE
jgi:hypothetical protein